MSIDLEVRLLSPEELANPAVPPAGLSQAPESADWIILSMGAVFVMLIDGAVSALRERRLAGVNTSLVIVAIGRNSPILGTGNILVLILSAKAWLSIAGALDRPPVLGPLTRRPRHQEDGCLKDKEYLPLSLAVSG